MTRLVRLKSHWKASETRPPTQQRRPILRVRHRPPIGEKKEKERNDPTAVTFSCAAWDKKNRIGGGGERGREGSHYRLLHGPKRTIPLVQSDRPLPAWRRATVGGREGDKVKGKKTAQKKKYWFQLLDYSFSRLILVQICFQSMTTPTSQFLFLSVFLFLL